jgi:[ribosomal protein S18]-alanine N-acetyltransferase
MIERETAGPPEAIEVHLVPMRRRHLRSVFRIEAQVYPRPWSLPLFMSELNLRTTRAYFVARVDGTVVGYAGLMFTGEDAHVTTGAQSMYKQFGFVGAGVRKNYYAETNEDALVMWAEHIDTEDYAARLTAIEGAVPGTTIIDTGHGER